MKTIIYTPLLFFMLQTLTIFDFTNNSNIQDWYVVNDGVMGGLSKGSFSLNEEGNAVFRGAISLENNGGFSSVRYRFPEKKVNKYSKVVLKIKGDGKRYQFRVKSDLHDRYSYIHYFETNKQWQTIAIDLNMMYPTFRGRKLDLPNYPGAVMQEIAFLIGNKKAEEFQLIIDSIELH